jgi:hypothetical protein
MKISFRVPRRVSNLIDVDATGKLLLASLTNCSLKCCIYVFLKQEAIIIY